MISLTSSYLPKGVSICEHESVLLSHHTSAILNVTQYAVYESCYVLFDSKRVWHKSKSDKLLGNVQIYELWSYQCSVVVTQVGWGHSMAPNHHSRAGQVGWRHPGQGVQVLPRHTAQAVRVSRSLGPVALWHQQVLRQAAPEGVPLTDQQPTHYFLLYIDIISTYVPCECSTSSLRRMHWLTHHPLHISHPRLDSSHPQWHAHADGTFCPHTRCSSAGQPAQHLSASACPLSWQPPASWAWPSSGWCHGWATTSGCPPSPSSTTPPPTSPSSQLRPGTQHRHSLPAPSTAISLHGAHILLLKWSIALFGVIVEPLDTFNSSACPLPGTWRICQLKLCGQLTLHFIHNELSFVGFASNLCVSLNAEY